MRSTNLSGSQELHSAHEISGRRGTFLPLAAGILVLLAGLALGALMQMFPGAWVGLTGADAPARNQMASDVAAVVADGVPRLVSSPGAAAGRERIRALFAPYVALEDHSIKLSRGVAGPVDLVNLVGRIKGTDAAAGTIAVVSHSDSVRVSPGAGDAAAGVAAVAQVVRALALEPPKHDVIVLITDGEEAGLLGARAFMEQHPWAGELQGVLNLDARGAAGPAYVFELGANTQELIPALKRHVRAPRTTSLAAWIYSKMPNGTDFMVFLRAGLTGYNVAFIGDHPAYHTPQDTPERLNPSTLHHYGATALALIRSLDEMGPWQRGQGQMAERAAWTDIAGLWVLSWPERWSALIAFMVSAGVVVPAFWRAARSRASAGAIGFTIGGILVCMTAAGLLGMAVQWGAGSQAITTHTSPGQTLALHTLLWLAAAVLVCCAGALKPVRLAPDECTTFAGVWIVWAVACCASGLLLPAASPLLVIPVACAAVGFALGGKCGTRAAVVWGSLAGTAGGALAWLPLEPAFLDALGLGLAPVTGVRATLLLTPLMPLVALATTGSRTVTPQTQV